ncbi:MAG TPA: flagellar basal body P-ring formation chaperone FlgA [Steroidobacteraceae bacterium]|jgi:flagella basal body P-ring formation protein FlgA|nr:flagellar basal body P-ring formation chaperone FlgA [Steroidobacteraceae bacterium]
MRITPKFRRQPEPARAPAFRPRNPAPFAAAAGAAAAALLLGAPLSADASTSAISSGASSAAVAAPRGNFEDIASLESLARAEAGRQFPPLTDHQRMVVGPLEPQLELERCRQPVRAGLTTARHMQDRATIELKCQDLKPWHIYVQIRIVGTSPVVVAAHAIVAGTVLKDGDFRVEQRDLSQLPPGFLDDPAIAAGLTASRPISEGAFITNQQLLAARVVQRGQAVTLLADAGGISVRMAGKALSDGLINQRVKVQNLSSGRVVEGIARSEQVVQIILD